MDSLTTILFGKDPDPAGYCSGECKFYHKFRSIFPLDSDSNLSSNLYVFDYKYIFFYTDHISVFKAND